MKNGLKDAFTRSSCCFPNSLPFGTYKSLASDFSTMYIKDSFHTYIFFARINKGYVPIFKFKGLSFKTLELLNFEI